MERDRLKSILESLLFAADGPVTLARIREMDVARRELIVRVDELRADEKKTKAAVELLARLVEREQALVGAQSVVATVGFDRAALAGTARATCLPSRPAVGSGNIPAPRSTSR